MTWVHPCGFRPPMPNISVAEAFKKSGKIHVPIVALGAVESLDAAEEILREGKADLVTMARSLIADPELIHKAQAGHGEDVIPCIKCMRCHDSTVYGHHFQCAVNPEAGLDACLSKLVKAPEKSKKVAIIGGGPAGMKAACVASDRGHQVTLFEEQAVLGGALNFADYVSFKYPLAGYKNWLIAQVEKRPIEVKCSTRATPEQITGFDAVLVAVGAQPLMLPVPGVEQAKVATAVYGKESQLGNTVIVIGGGQVGCETALHLAKLGKRVTVLEMQSALAPDASKTHRDELMVEIEKEPNFVTLTDARCTGISATSVTFVQDGAEQTITADDVILAAGMKPKAEEADAFIGTAPEFAEIGDCVRARTVEWATKEAYYAAVNL
jgi:NADPH-dependent 2,4-dienoyl-CoA reductase/sulfur reductase-like enzyme